MIEALNTMQAMQAASFIFLWTVSVVFLCHKAIDWLFKRKEPKKPVPQLWGHEALQCQECGTTFEVSHPCCEYVRCPNPNCRKLIPSNLDIASFLERQKK